MTDEPDIATNLRAVAARVTAAARAAGRDPATVTLVAVAKTFGEAAVRAAVARGDDGIKTAIITTPDGPEQNTLAIATDEAHKNGLFMFTHAVTVIDTLAAVRAKVDVLAHTPHIGRLDEDEAAVQEIAKAGIPMASTLAIFVPRFIGTDNTPTFRDLLPFPWETLSSAGQFSNNPGSCSSRISL